MSQCDNVTLSHFVKVVLRHFGSCATFCLSISISRPAACEAAEDLGVPGGADHHVRQLHRPDAARVAELVNAPE